MAAAAFPLRFHAATGAGISLGFSLYGMKTVPLDEALKTCAAIGYRNVEFALNAGYPTAPQALSADARKVVRGQLDSLKLELSGFMLNMSLAVDDKAHAQNLEAIKAAAQLAHDLVPENPPLIETVLGGKPAEWDEIKERMASRLRDWAAAADAAKMTIAIKAHVGSAVNSPERLLWLLEKAGSPAIKAAYDYSHFELAGIALADSLKLLVPHTKFIHVKDSAGDAKKFQFLLPGEGRTDYVTYFKLLRQFGYSGPIVVEVSAQVFNKPGYDPIAAAKKCYAALSTAMEKAGVDRGAR
jgi:sugar phosphate isomerase/epimerase